MHRFFNRLMIDIKILCKLQDEFIRDMRIICHIKYEKHKIVKYSPYGHSTIKTL